MKPGWKTTEFWITTLIITGNILSVISGIIPADWALVASALASGAYAISRGLAKGNEDDK